MGQGIQIKKPEHSDTKVSAVNVVSSASDASLPPAFLLMLILSFPASLVALYFFLQTRAV